MDSRPAAPIAVRLAGWSGRPARMRGRQAPSLPSAPALLRPRLRSSAGASACRSLRSLGACASLRTSRRAALPGLAPFGFGIAPGLLSVPPAPAPYLHRSRLPCAEPLRSPRLGRSALRCGLPHAARLTCPLLPSFRTPSKTCRFSLIFSSLSPRCRPPRSYDIPAHRILQDGSLHKNIR